MPRHGLPGIRGDLDGHRLSRTGKGNLAVHPVDAAHGECHRLTLAVNEIGKPIVQGKVAGEPYRDGSSPERSHAAQERTPVPGKILLDQA